jgi:thiol-disulfide isomerase/thioredoxin
MRVRPGLLAVLTAALVTTTACGQHTRAADRSAVSGQDTPTPTVAASAAAGPVPAGLGFTATTVDGARFDAATLAGRPTLLWFWARWCPTCAGEAPLVSRLAARHAGKVNVVGVAGLDKQPAMRDFVARTKVSGFVNLPDEAGAVWQRFGVTAQATYVLLDAAGRVVYAGYLDDDELTARIDRLAA